MGGAPPLPLDFASQGPEKGDFSPFFGAREPCPGTPQEAPWGPRGHPGSLYPTPRGRPPPLGGTRGTTPTRTRIALPGAPGGPHGRVLLGPGTVKSRGATTGEVLPEVGREGRVLGAPAVSLRPGRTARNLAAALAAWHAPRQGTGTTPHPRTRGGRLARRRRRRPDCVAGVGVPPLPPLAGDGGPPPGGPPARRPETSLDPSPGVPPLDPLPGGPPGAPSGGVWEPPRG